MPRAIGANCRLLVTPEATYGTAPAGDWLRMPFLSCDLGAEQPLLDADVIGVGSSRDPAAPFLDTVTVQGQAVVPVDLINIGHWLRLLLGPPTTTGTSPNFIHSFGSGAAALPSNSIEVGYPDVPNFDLCTGVRADTLEIDFSPTGPATATFGLMGQGSTRGANSSGGTPTSAAYTAFNKAQGAISRNGSALAQVTGARLTYANGMEMVRTIRADRKVEGVDPGIARATGQITARFADTVLLTQAQNNGNHPARAAVWSGSGGGGVDGLSALPVPRQQFAQARCRVVGDAGQHVREPCARIDVVELRGDDERVHRRGALAAAIGAGEQP
jgi:hypothetical protein